MYVCICNNITSKKISDAVEEGISDSALIHHYFNCKPRCGKCIEFMKEIIEQELNVKTKEFVS